MKGKTNFITSLLVFIAGVILIVMFNKIDIMETIVIVLGCALLIPGFINLVISAFARRAESAGNRVAYTLGLVVSVFAIALGAAMVFAPHIFAQAIAYVFAALIIAGGFYHILAVSYLARPFILPAYFYIVPVLLIIAGFVILFTGVRALDNIVVLITGISMVASSISSLIEHIATHPSKPNIAEKAESASEEA